MIAARAIAAPPTDGAVIAAPAPSGVTVQIGAFPSAAQTKTNWRELKVALPDELAGRAMAIEAGVNNGRTVYRGIVGDFASRADAAKFCAALSAAGRPCFVRASR